MSSLSIRPGAHPVVLVRFGTAEEDRYLCDADNRSPSSPAAPPTVPGAAAAAPLAAGLEVRTEEKGTPS
jgi:hypothetical protein